jgi:hypothetical protein
MGGGGRLVERDDVSENLPSEFCVPSSGSLILPVLLKNGAAVMFGNDVRRKTMAYSGFQDLILHN